MDGSADSESLGVTRVSIAISLVSASAVAYQVALVRLLSVAIWYHFAFLVVSLAVLGFGLSGMLMVLRPELVLRSHLPRNLAVSALSLSLSVFLAYGALAWIPFDPFQMGTEPAQVGWALLFVLIIMLPLFFAGLTAGMILIDQASQSGRVYAADLVGAGAGSILAVAALSVLGGPVTMLVTAPIAALGAVVVQSGKWRVLTGALTALSLLLALVLPQSLEIRITEDKVLGTTSIAEIIQDPERKLETRWNSMSRVDLVQLGGNRVLLIDAGVALTRLPHIRKPIEEIPPFLDFTTIPFSLVDRPDVLVLGSGGGWEVAGALSHGARKVTAVEINPAINELVQSEDNQKWLHGLFENPRVDLVTDEGRAFLSRSDTRWDVIVSAHTISNAATSTGAMNLAESYMLTEEAFDSYLTHLTPTGVLFITRPEAQVPRLVATASAALVRAGKPPKSHLVAVRLNAKDTQSFTAGVLVAMDGSTLRGISPQLAKFGAIPILLPEERLVPPEYALPLQGLGETLATDDRPFFNIQTQWSDLTWANVKSVLSAGRDGRQALEGEPVSEVSVVILILLLIALALVSVGGPLWLQRANLSPRKNGLTILYFGGLGLGFMFAELGLVHRLGVFLGSPTLTFGVVVAGLLVFSGIGASLSSRITNVSAHHAVQAVVVTLVIAGAFSSPLVAWGLGLSSAGRVVLAIAVVAPIGLAIGMPFPLGLRIVGSEDSRLLTVAWGVNGFASVFGSVITILLATTLGFSWLLIIAGLVYIVPALVLKRFTSDQ